MRIDDSFIKGGSFIIAHRSGEVPHRAWIIVEAAELETALADRFLDWLAIVNPTVDRDRAREDLIDEGPLGSLTKLAEIAFHAGLIGVKMRNDLRKIAKLRDRYAHDRNRGQLDADAPMFKFVQDTFLYKENREQLLATPNLHEQRSLLAVCAQLKLMLKTGVIE